MQYETRRPTLTHGHAIGTRNRGAWATTTVHHDARDPLTGRRAREKLELEDIRDVGHQNWIRNIDGAEECRRARGLAHRQRRPEPRLALGLGLRRVASAAIDISDGLAQDLGHLCRASGVGATLHAAALPRSAAGRAATTARSDPWGPALNGGEDYELCVTVQPARLAAANRAAARAGLPLTVVGEVTGRRGVRVLGPDGRAVEAGRGHDHLASRPGSGQARGAMR